MLIDCSYFVTGPRAIQNATLGNSLLPNPNAIEVNEAITAYIRHYQWRFLKGVLGLELAVEVANTLKAIETDGESAPTAHDELIEQLKEPFADYVFFKILRSSNSQATITGLERLKSANSYVAPIQRQVTAWNEMVERLEEIAALSGGAIKPGKNFITRINTLNL